MRRLLLRSKWHEERVGSGDRMFGSGVLENTNHMNTKKVESRSTITEFGTGGNNNLRHHLGTWILADLFLIVGLVGMVG